MKNFLIALHDTFLTAGVMAVFIIMLFELALYSNFFGEAIV